LGIIISLLVRTYVEAVFVKKNRLYPRQVVMRLVVGEGYAYT
jgi:hypothetical protein